MGILVQREFKVAIDDRREFERQSRLGLWEDQRNNGSQMIAFGGWAFGGDASVLVTHSAYADFDHWTATRQYGVFNQEPERAEEAKQWRQIFAGRSRLIEYSSASIYDYDDELSEPTPGWRNVGEPRVALPPTFGLQSVVAETTFELVPGAEDDFRQLTRDTLMPWYREQGARPMIYASNPLGSSVNVVLMVAYPTITAWHQCARPDLEAWDERVATTYHETTRLLMVNTEFGERISSAPD
jgi:hypothetical protein